MRKSEEFIADHVPRSSIAAGEVVGSILLGILSLFVLIGGIIGTAIGWLFGAPWRALTRPHGHHRAHVHPTVVKARLAPSPLERTLVRNH